MSKAQNLSASDLRKLTRENTLAGAAARCMSDLKTRISLAAWFLPLPYIAILCLYAIASIQHSPMNIPANADLRSRLDLYYLSANDAWMWILAFHLLFLLAFAGATVFFSKWMFSKNRRKLDIDSFLKINKDTYVDLVREQGGDARTINRQLRCAVWIDVGNALKQKGRVADKSDKFKRLESLISWIVIGIIAIVILVAALSFPEYNGLLTALMLISFLVILSLYFRSNPTDRDTEEIEMSLPLLLLSPVILIGMTAYLALFFGIPIISGLPAAIMQAVIPALLMIRLASRYSLMYRVQKRVVQLEGSQGTDTGCDR